MNHRRPGRIQTPRTVTDEVMLASKSFLLTGKLVQKRTLVLHRMSLHPSSNRLHSTLQFSVIRQLKAPISIIIGWTGHRVAPSFNPVETFIRSNKIHDSRQIRGSQMELALITLSFFCAPLCATMSSDSGLNPRWQLWWILFHTHEFLYLHKGFHIQLIPTESEQKTSEVIQ